MLAGVRGNITKLALADNLLGDNLNPIFSTAELHNLPALEELDLSGNSIRGLEEGLLIGCDVLKVRKTFYFIVFNYSGYRMELMGNELTSNRNGII